MRRTRVLAVLGPGLVAAVAYVDPGNVAANLSAGSTYGYALVWVLLAANAMAMVMQYLSAKLGIVTGYSLAELVTGRLRATRGGSALRVAYATQAIVVMIATDVAEIIGGAIALHLLFGTPLWAGGLLVGITAMVILTLLRRGTPKPLELGVTAFLIVIALGFVGLLWWTPPDAESFLLGMRPSVPDMGAWSLIAAMLGATVMPHAIYVHSSLAREHHATKPSTLHRLLRLQWVDVGSALLVAGSVNIALLLIGATIAPQADDDVITATFDALGGLFGPVVPIVFAVALLASGLGSAIVGAHAGSEIVRDLVGIQLPPIVRRAITVVGALALLMLPLTATELLILSQIVLSFGIGFAALPLVRFTSDPTIMGEHANTLALRVISGIIAALIVALNVVIIWVTFTG